MKGSLAGRGISRDRMRIWSGGGAGPVDAGDGFGKHGEDLNAGVVRNGLRVDVDDHAHTVPTACRRMLWKFDGAMTIEISGVWNV